MSANLKIALGISNPHLWTNLLICNLTITLCDEILFSVLFDYVLSQSNITLEFDCIEQVSNSLPVTITDIDGIVLIPLYNMRTGIGQVYKYTRV